MANALSELAKLITRQIRKGQPFSLSAEFGQKIAITPGAPEELVVLLAEEAGKTRPNTKLLQVYEAFLTDTLMELVQGAKAGRTGMAETLRNVEAEIVALVQEGDLTPEAFLSLLRLLQDAGHVPGEAFRDALTDNAGSRAESMDISGVIDGLAQVVQEMGGDVFGAYQQMQPMLAAMPVPGRAAMGFELLVNDRHPAARSLGLGWLFDEEAEVRQLAANGIRQAAERGRLTPDMLRRLILSRNLLPAALHPDIDAAIRTARLKGVDCPPLPEPVVIEFLASGVDGAGAQSLFVQVKQGRKQALVSILLKLGQGVLDAWVRTGMSKAEMSSILDEVYAQMGLNLSGPLYLRQALGHFLAMNVETGQTIPFALLQVAEALALPPLTPERPPPREDLLRDILAGVPPEETDAKAFERARKISAYWAESLPFAASWFENGPEIDRLLKGKRMSQEKQAEEILRKILPGKRDRWIDILTRTGLSMREGDRKGIWIDYLLLARALAEGQPPSALPFMQHVAANSAQAWCYQNGLTRLPARPR